MREALKRRNIDRKRLLKWLFIIVASFGGTWSVLSLAIQSLTPQSNTGFFSTNSIFSLLLFIAICKVLMSVSVADRHKTCICAVFAALLCSSIVIGHNLQLTGWPNVPGYAGLGEIATYLKILFLIPFATALVMHLVDLVDRVRIEPEGAFRFDRRRYFLVVWGIIFLCWVPWLLIVFPGVYGCDSAYQVAQMISDNVPVTTHHPPLHTFILGGLVKVGMGLFGSKTAGLAIYSILQMLVMAASCAFCCCTLRFDLKTGRWIARLSAAFFGLFPLCAIFSMSATKDVLFSCAVLVAICLLARTALAKERANVPWRSTCALAAVLLAALLLRNNMLPALVLSAPLLILLVKGARRKAVVSSLSIAIVGCLVTTSVLYPALGVERGRLQGEMYSVPLSQLARTVNAENANLTPEEEEWIKEVIPLWDEYDARIADKAKASFDKEAFEDDLLENIGIYLRIGAKNPGEFTNQFLDMTAGYWFPGKVFRDRAAYHPYILWDETYGIGFEPPEDRDDFMWIDRASLFPALDEIMAKVIYHCGWQYVPVVSLLFSPGFILWCWLFVCAFLIYRRRCTSFVPLLIPLMIELTNMLGPLVQPRYAFILFLGLPLLVGVLFSRAAEESTNGDRAVTSLSASTPGSSPSRDACCPRA